MRVAFVIDSLVGGGAERATVNLANGLAQNDYAEITIFTLKEQVDEYCLNSNIVRNNCLTGRFISDIRILKAELKKNNIDVAIGMSIYANFCLCAANFFLNTKVIISERNAPKYDHISWKSKLLRWILYRNADQYVFQTQEARDFYSKSIQKRSVIIHNPVRTDIPYKSSAGKKEIVAIGRLVQQKNYPLLLEAFAEVHKHYPEYILRIFGQGKEQTALEALCEKLNIQNSVVFEGFCLDVHEQIKDASFFVMSSDFEGMPNSLMEAMAMGFPVVCTDCPAGGPRELVEHMENGVLVPVGDVKTLRDAIITLIEDENVCRFISNNAKSIRDTHNIDVIIRKWVKLIEEGVY